MTDDERRRHRRVNFNCKVRITHPDIGSRIFEARDISDSGMFLLVDPATLPPVGSIIEGQVQGLNEEGPVLKLEIVRVTDHGAGLRICGDKLLH